MKRSRFALALFLGMLAVSLAAVGVADDHGPNLVAPTENCGRFAGCGYLTALEDDGRRFCYDPMIYWNWPEQPRASVPLSPLADRQQPRTELRVASPLPVVAAGQAGVIATGRATVLVRSAAAALSVAGSSVANPPNQVQFRTVDRLPSAMQPNHDWFADDCYPYDGCGMDDYYPLDCDENYGCNPYDLGCPAVAGNRWSGCAGPTSAPVDALLTGTDNRHFDEQCGDWDCGGATPAPVHRGSLADKLVDPMNYQAQSLGMRANAPKYLPRVAASPRVDVRLLATELAPPQPLGWIAHPPRCEVPTLFLLDRSQAPGGASGFSMLVVPPMTQPAASTARREAAESHVPQASRTLGQRYLVLAITYTEQSMSSLGLLTAGAVALAVDGMEPETRQQAWHTAQRWLDELVPPERHARGNANRGL